MVNSNGKFEVKRPVMVGDTADIHLQRALTILRNENINPTVLIELAPQNSGVFCGLFEHFLSTSLSTFEHFFVVFFASFLLAVFDSYFASFVC